MTIAASITKEIARLSALLGSDPVYRDNAAYYEGQLQAYRNVLATLDPTIDDHGAGITLPR